MYDYVIIGAGIIGSLIARELSRYEVSVLLLDKENDIANHQTTANSAIIHAGHDPKEGSLKAKLCVLGNKLYDTLEKELAIPLLRSGAFVVAHDAEEEKLLKALLEKAQRNGVRECAIITGDEARKVEPRLSIDVSSVLSLPSTKVTYPWEVAIAAVSNAMKNGVTLMKNAHVIAIDQKNDGFILHVEDKETISAKHVINASGVMADHIANMIEKDCPYTIIPKRGEYFVLDRKAKGLFNHVLYPLPTQKGKGVLIVPQVHGNILLGPTSYEISKRDDVSTTQEGLTYVKEHLSRLSHHIPYDLIIRTFAGVRASSPYEDFYIQESKFIKGFFHVAGIDSPGLTAAPAIAAYLVNDVINIKAKLKSHFDPIRQKPLVFHSLSDDEKIKRISENPKYGHIVCKCEKITEQEIIDAINNPTGSDTIKGIKKRARAGSGLCQGGYCENTVLKIIARETGKPLSAINYSACDTPILLKETKST